MSFLKKIGGGLKKIGGVVSAVPGLGTIGAIGGIAGSLLQGRAPNIGQLAGIVPGLGTIGAIGGIAGGLGSFGGGRGRGSTNMNVMPGGVPSFQPPPAFNFTQPPITGGGGSGSMGGLPAIIPSATALQRFLSWAAAIALGQTAADAIAQLIQNNVPWSSWQFGLQQIWTQFTNSQSNGFDAGSFDSCMMPIVVDPTYEMRATAPRGYVIVEHNGIKVAMEKGRARQCGKWKPAKKPPITAAEYRQLQTAVRVEKKIKTLATKSGQICRPRKR